MTARWAVRAADRARRSELAPQAPERVWGDALHRKGTGFPPYPSASSIPLFLEWLAQTVGQRDRYGGGGYPVAAPTDRKLPTFMKHAQHPTVARFAVGWLRCRWAAGLQLPHSFACPYEQAPQVSQKYSVRDGSDSYRRLQMHRYTATGFANDVCQGGKVYAGRGLPFPRVCQAWDRSVLPSCPSHRGPFPSHLRGRLCGSVNILSPG